MKTDNEKIKDEESVPQKTNQPTYKNSNSGASWFTFYKKIYWLFIPWFAVKLWFFERVSSHDPESIPFSFKMCWKVATSYAMMKSGHVLTWDAVQQKHKISPEEIKENYVIDRKYI